MRRSFFLARTSGLRSLHPLTKLILVIAIVLVGFLAPSPHLPLLLFAVVVLPLAAWGKFARELIQTTFTVTLPFILSIVLVQGLFYPGASHILLALGPVALKQEGLVFAYGTSSRILLLAGAGLVLLFSTSPSDLMHALAERGMPRGIAYMVVAAIQLLPQMQARGTAILDAQRARGLETQGNLWARTRAIIPLLAPLVYSALGDVDERAMALEARAFAAQGEKTSYTELTDTRIQAAARWGLFAFAVIIGVVEIAVR